MPDPPLLRPRHRQVYQPRHHGYKGGINLYGFTGNNPVNQSDPSGYGPPGSLDEWYSAWDNTTLSDAWDSIRHSVTRNGNLRMARHAFLEAGGIAATYNPFGSGEDILGARVLGAAVPWVFRTAKVANLVRKVKPWTLAEHAEGTMMHPRFGRFYKMKGRNQWWSVDTAGHGGSAFKVFRQEGREMKWIEDADKNGNFLRGKHKGPTGLTIPLGEFHG